MSCQIFLIFSCFTHDPWLIYVQLTTHTHRMRMCERRRHRDIILFYAFQYAWEKISPLHVKIHISGCDKLFNRTIQGRWMVRDKAWPRRRGKKSITDERKSLFWLQNGIFSQLLYPYRFIRWAAALILSIVCITIY